LHVESTKKVGIYGLLCKITGKWYIGYSTDIDHRWYYAYKCMHCRQQPKIYNAIKKHGYENFDKVIVEECDNIDWILDYREMHWIKVFDSVNKGYNLTHGGQNGKMSVESRQKISKANIGNKRHFGMKHTDESRKKMSEALLGKPLSGEHRKLLSKIRKGKKKPVGFGDKIKAFHTGRKRSEETKEKLRLSWIKRKEKALA
jgi:group I intron endonuclease